MTRLTFTLEGQLASKSNKRRFAVIDGVSRSVKSRAAQAFVAGALPQIPVAARQSLAGPIRVRLVCYYASRRPDLDEQLVLDVLQDQWARTPRGKRLLVQPGVYANDRQIVERHVYKRLDTKRPRVAVTVWTLPKERAL